MLLSVVCSAHSQGEKLRSLNQVLQFFSLREVFIQYVTLWAQTLDKSLVFLVLCPLRIVYSRVHEHVYMCTWTLPSSICRRANLIQFDNQRKKKAAASFSIVESVLQTSSKQSEIKLNSNFNSDMSSLSSTKLAKMDFPTFSYFLSHLDLIW